MNEQIILLKALSDETRYNIIKLLLAYDLCVGALARRLGISEAAVSQQLQVLRKAGLIQGEKRGYWTHYWVQRDVLGKLAADLQEIVSQPAQRQLICRKEDVQTLDLLERRGKRMCKCNCQFPEKHDGKDQCAPEKIRECHGESENHPCEENKGHPCGKGEDQ